MVNNDNFDSFINTNYTEFRKPQCAKRLLILWGCSLLITFLEKVNILHLSLTILANICLSIFFIILMIKFPKAQTSRFYCDGFTYLYVSILFNVLSCKLLALRITNIWIIAILFLFLLFLSVFLTALIFYSKIKSDKHKKSKTKYLLPIVTSTTGLGGVLLARYFFSNIDINITIIFASILSLIVSLLLGIIPSINFLKIYLLKTKG